MQPLGQIKATWPVMAVHHEQGIERVVSMSCLMSGRVYLKFGSKIMREPLSRSAILRVEKKSVFVFSETLAELTRCISLRGLAREVPVSTCASGVQLIGNAVA